MPIYEYQCSSCGFELEKIQKFSDAALRQCPECKKESLNKLVSASAFRLKGGGWYETDFKTGKKKNIAGEGGSDPKPSSGSSTSASKPSEKKSSADTKANK